MSPRWIVLALLLTPLAQVARAEDEEPSFLDRKLSVWLDQMTKGKDAKTRRKGVVAVEQIGHDRSRKVIPALVQALREDREPLVRSAAARAVGRAVARALDQARTDKKEEPRFDYAREALTTALRTEKSEEVREAAALGLSDMGPDARGSVGTLAAALKDPHVPVVKAAALALRRMGRDAQEAQPDLQRLVADKKADLEARLDAAQTMGLIKPDAGQATPVLRDVVLDAKADLRLRKAAIEALGKMGKDAADATPALALVLLDRDSTTDLRLSAVTAINAFGPDGKAAIPALIKAVSDESLIRRMGDESRFVRCMAMHALGKMGRELDRERREAAKALIRATEEPVAEVCVTAIETLGAMAIDGFGGEGEEVLKRIDTLIAREGRKPIREAAQATRKKIVPDKKP